MVAETAQVSAIAVDTAPSTRTSLTWSEVKTLTGHLAAEVQRDGIPDVVVGVLRGGLIPAVLLAHQLGVRTVRAVEVLHTTGEGTDAAKTPMPVIFNVHSLGDLTGADVLIADDVAGSGDTLATTGDLVRAAGARRVRTAPLVVNVANWRQSQPPEEVLTYIGRIVQGWVCFPWEQP